MEATDVAYTALPDGATTLPPGPELAALLWSVDPARCNAFQLTQLAQAHYRQVCAEQARLLSVVRELACSRPGRPDGPPVRGPGADCHADTELACALALTDGAAGGWLSLAHTAVVSVPALREAMLAGEVDLPKLRMFTAEFSDVPDEQARAVVGRLRADLARCTVGQVRGKARRLLLHLDPAAARERRARSVQRRTVDCHTYANGTAMLSAVYLPTEKAAAAWDNVDAIARATHRAGDPLSRTLNQLRADVFADLLAGVDPAAAGAAIPAPRHGVVYVHVDLAALAGLTESPATLEGFGPVLAEVARDTVRQLGDRTQWRHITTGGGGRLLAEGNLRYRPTTSQARYVRTRDVTCRAPGCQRPARHCDLDHIRSWNDGGPTQPSNLLSLCRHHHRAKHRGGHRVRLTGDTVEWTTSRGRRYAVPPERAHTVGRLRR